MVAAAIALGYVAYLRPGELATLRVRNLVAPNRPGTKGATGRFFTCYSRGRKWHPKQNSHFRRLGDPRQTGPVVDGSALACPDCGASRSRLIPMDENEIARELKTIFEDLGCSKLGVVAYSLRHGGPSWDFVKKFHNLDEIQQRGRWRSPTSVLRYQKSSKLLRCS